MTRRRLWAATTVCCALLALPTLLRLIGLVMPAGLTWHTTLDTTRRVTASVLATIQSAALRTAHALTTASNMVDGWHASSQTLLTLGALTVALAALAMLVADRLRLRRRSTAPQRARRLAQRGEGVGVIARRTGLSQDAVRQLIHPHLESDRAAFADLLAASLDPTLVPSTRSRSDR